MKSDLRDEDRIFLFNKAISEVDKWMERFDCLVVGPGLGRDPYLLVCFSLPNLSNFKFVFQDIEISYVVYIVSL